MHQDIPNITSLLLLAVLSFEKERIFLALLVQVIKIKSVDDIFLGSMNSWINRKLHGYSRMWKKTGLICYLKQQGVFAFLLYHPWTGSKSVTVCWMKKYWYYISQPFREHEQDQLLRISNFPRNICNELNHKIVLYKYIFYILIR